LVEPTNEPFVLRISIRIEEIGSPVTASVTVPEMLPRRSRTKSMPDVEAPAVTTIGVPLVGSQPLGAPPGHARSSLR